MLSYVNIDSTKRSALPFCCFRQPRSVGGVSVRIDCVRVKFNVTVVFLSPYCYSLVSWLDGFNLRRTPWAQKYPHIFLLLFLFGFFVRLFVCLFCFVLFFPSNSVHFHATYMKVYDFVDEVACCITNANCQLFPIDTQITLCTLLKHRGSLWFVCWLVACLLKSLR